MRDFRTVAAVTLLVVMTVLPFFANPGYGSLLASSTSEANTALLSDFTLSTSPSVLVISEGTTGSSSLTLASEGGFSGNVILSASSFFDVHLDKTNLTLASGGAAGTTITAYVPTGTPSGNYTVTVQGFSGCTLSHSASILLEVTGPDFTMSASKAQLTAPPSGSDATSILLTSKDGFSGSVSLSTFSITLNPNLSPTTVSLIAGGTGTATLTVAVPSTTEPGSYSIEVAAFDNTLSHVIDIPVLVTGSGFSLSSSPSFLTVQAGASSNSSTITVTPFGGFTGTVLLTNASRPAGLSTQLAPTSLSVSGSQTSILTITAPSGTTAGAEFQVTVTGAASPFSVSTYVFVTVKGPDFAISTSPLSVMVAAGGSSCTSAIVVTSLNGFSGTVGLTDNTFPTGLTASLSVSSITTGGTTVLTVSAPSGTTPGYYYVEVDGTSGPLSHFASVSVLVTGPDFTLSASPVNFRTTSGSTQTSTITVASANGFVDSAGLSATSSTFVTASVGPSSVSGAGTATLTVTVSPSAPLGTTVVEVSGASTSLTHSLFVSITVGIPDFSLSSPSSPAILTIRAGSASSTTITVSSDFGFTGPVNLTATVSPPGPTVSFNSDTVAYGSGSSTLTITVGSNVTPGNYTITVTGTSGAKSHSEPVLVAVMPASPSGSLGASGLTTTLILVSISAIVVSVGAGYLIIRKRKKTV